MRTDSGQRNIDLGATRLGAGPRIKPGSADPERRNPAVSIREPDSAPWSRVELTIMTLSRGIRSTYDVRLADLGLNVAEAGVLACLQEHGSLTQAGLTERLGLRGAATGAIADTLERRGLIERWRHEDDRSMWVVAARVPAALIEQIEALDRALRERLRAGITTKERQQLAATLAKLQHNLSSLADQP